MEHAAVVYFSQTGTTANAAAAIHQVVGGPLIELHRQPAYPTSYKALVAAAQAERDTRTVPALMPLTASLEDVTTVFLGFPSWWAQPPMVINAFFASEDLQGKTIVPFTTSVSSTIEESMATLQQLATAAGATVAPGLTATGNGDIDAFMAQYH